MTRARGDVPPSRPEDGERWRDLGWLCRLAVVLLMALWFGGMVWLVGDRQGAAFGVLGAVAILGALGPRAAR